MQTKKYETFLYDTHAELGIIGAVMSGNEQTVDDIFNSLKAEYFGSEESQGFFVLANELYNSGTKIDFVTMADKMERSGNKRLNINLLTSATQISPCVDVDYKNYIKIIIDYYQLRRYRDLGTNILTACAKKINADKITDNINQFSEQVQKLTDEQQKGNAVENISIATKQELQHVDDIILGKYDNFGIATGFPLLDDTLWGLQKSNLDIIGARAGVGKTAMAINILNHAAIDLKKNCLFFSLEMPKAEISQRLLGLRAGVKNKDIRKAKDLTDEQKTSLNNAQKDIDAGNLYIDDTGNQTVANMLLKAKQMQRERGLDLVIIDYLQFVRPSQHLENRFLEVGEIARDLKVMARQLDVPVIALCQLNRKLDNENRTPTLSDLRESGEIENNADIVMFLNSNDDRYAEIKKMDVIIAKFRNGQARTIKMQYEGAIYKFTELEKLPEPKKSSELVPVSEDELPF